MLHIIMLVGLVSSVGALIGFALSFARLSPIVGGMISSVSMLSAFFIINKMRSYCSHHYVELVIAPNVNDCIRGSLDILGCRSPVITLIEVCVYFGVGALLVSLGAKSPAAISALTGAIISILYISVFCINQLIEYFYPEKYKHPGSYVNRDVTLTEALEEKDDGQIRSSAKRNT